MHLQSVTYFINSAKQELDKGNTPGAAMQLKQAKPLLEKLTPKHTAWLAYYVNLSAVYNNTGRFVECIEACEKARDVAPFRGETLLKGQIASAEATAWINTGNNDNALYHSGCAIALFQQAGAAKEVGMATLKQGSVLCRTGQWVEAIENFSKAIRVSKEYGDVNLEVKALLEIGIVFRQKRLLYLAIDHFREAEWKSKANGYVLYQAKALFERAATYLALDRQKDAQICMQEIEKITPEDSVMRSFLLRLHYKIALRQKEYSSALDYAQQFRAFFEKAGDQNGTAESLVLIGNAHYHLGQLEEAKEYATAALEKAEQIRDMEIIAFSSDLLAQLSTSSGDAANKGNEVLNEKEPQKEQKPPTILDILDDIAREEERVRSEQILGLVLSDIGGEEKFEICEERPGGPYVLRPTAPTRISFYRGQTAFHEPCLPTLYRSKDNGEEKDAVDFFIERLRAIEFELLLQDHPFVKEVYDKGVNVNCMGKQKTVPLKVSYDGLAQHYGLETDMIDFTSDKWVAAFFATNQYTPDGYKPINKGKCGIIYLYKPPPESQENISDPHYSPRLETVGLQPFSRPGEQRAFALRLDKGENMNKIPSVHWKIFRHNQTASKIIHSRMNQGNCLFPPDELIPMANKIKETKKFSIKAFDLTWQRHSITGIDKEKVIHALKQKNIKICNHTLFRLPKDLTRRFTHNWQKEGAGRFYDKIVGRAEFMMENEMAHDQ